MCEVSGNLPLYIQPNTAIRSATASSSGLSTQPQRNHQPLPNPHLNGEVGEILWIRLGASRSWGVVGQGPPFFSVETNSQSPRQKLADWKVTLLSFLETLIFRG